MQTGTFSLYLDIEPGQTANLEVIARASLAFVDAVREAAYVIDPSLDIDVSLVSGTEGSLSLNTLFKSKKVKDLLSTKNLIATMMLSFMWFGGHTRDWLLEKALERVTGMDTTAAHLSDEEIERISQKAADAVEKKIASGHVQQVYRELSADPAIKGVGATTAPSKRPREIIPRSEFHKRAGSNVEVPVSTRKRFRDHRESLTLVSPVLAEGDRRWEFIGSEGRMSASIKDHDFLSKVISGATGIRLRGGVRLEADVRSHEDFIDGAWHVQRREVLKVYGWTPEAHQHSFTIHSAHRSEDQ